MFRVITAVGDALAKHEQYAAQLELDRALGQAPSPPESFGLIRQMSFRSILLAKLNLIVWAYGGKRKACRRLKIPTSSFFRWYGDATSVPEYRNLAKIDEAYAVAYERRMTYERKLERGRLKRKQARDISVDGV